MSRDLDTPFEPVFAIERAGPDAPPLLAALARATLDNPWSENAFAKQLEWPGCSVWLAWARRPDAADAGRGDGDGPIAFLLVQRTLDELEIMNLAVAPEHRRRGIASALLARVLAEGSKPAVDVVHLEVRASNRAARLLYERHGFAVVGKRPRYYSDKTGNTGGEDALLMSLNPGIAGTGTGSGPGAKSGAGPGAGPT